MTIAGAPAFFEAAGAGWFVGLGRIVTGGSGAEQGPSLLRWVRKDRAVRSGSSGGVGPSEEAKTGGRAELARRRRSRRPPRRRPGVSA